ncbi:MAG: hypothetical protein ACYC8T_21725 [Myxococcaceae bacterium]
MRWWVLAAFLGGCVPPDEPAFFRCQLPERTCSQTDSQGRAYLCGVDSLCYPAVDPDQDQNQDDAGAHSDDAGPPDAGTPDSGTGAPDGGTDGGCADSSACESGEFCRFAKGACGLNGREGVCDLKPASCPSTTSPVCGCDGASYSSACDAAKKGVSVDRSGGC